MRNVSNHNLLLSNDDKTVKKSNEPGRIVVGDTQYSGVLQVKLPTFKPWYSPKLH